MLRRRNEVPIVWIAYPFASQGSVSSELPMLASGDAQLSPKSSAQFSFGSISSTSNEEHSSSRVAPPVDDEAEMEALEETLGELVVKAIHRLLWPGPTLILATAPSSEQINEVLSVSAYSYQ